MKTKNIIVLLTILLFVLCSNYYFMFYTPNELDKYSSWKMQTLEEKFQSEIVLSRYYNSQQIEENLASVRSALSDLRAMNKNYMREKECASYLEFKKNVDYNITLLDSLAKIKPNYITPFIFTQTVLSLQNNLDNILIKIDTDKNEFKDKTKFIGLFICLILLTTIIFFLFKYDKKRKTLSLQLVHNNDEKFNKLESKNRIHHETTYIQTLYLKESIEQLENHFKHNIKLSTDDYAPVEAKLKEIKNSLSELNLFTQSSIQGEFNSCELHTCFAVISMEYQEYTEFVNNLPKGIHVACDKQDVLVLIASLFKAALDNKRTERKLHLIANGKTKDKWIHLSFQDNGNGFSDQELNQLFKLQLNETNNLKKGRIRSFQYVLIHKIVTDYGGSIWVESTPNQGSIFNFSLPLSITNK